MDSSQWSQCLDLLQKDIPAREFNTWIRPLQVESDHEGLRLLAPNKFVLDRVSDHHLDNIVRVLGNLSGGEKQPRVFLGIGVRKEELLKKPAIPVQPEPVPGRQKVVETKVQELEGAEDENARYQNLINPNSTFDNYVEGESNRLARAAALTVAQNPGGSGYNPLYIYGGSGLGKTHLIHAVANCIMENNPQARVAYVRSENFVRNMVSAIRHSSMEKFKDYYRSPDVLLIDDIHFLAEKPQSQEEFFHTFNSVLESGQQMILTCDRYPAQIEGMEERLKSRFTWGMPVGIEPPELEMRVAILMRKAESENVELPQEAAFFIARYIQSNVRELEGVLKRVIAFAAFHGTGISVDLVREALKDVLAIHDRQVTIDLIQKTVAEECNIRVSDMRSNKRNRAVARPRQVAMALARELTKHSLPEIGEAFGGRDHTTVMHACKKIDELRGTDGELGDLYRVLLRKITR